MTPEAQRIAIAEACGWRCEVIGAGWCVYDPAGRVVSTGHRADHNIQSLADYIAAFYGPLNSYVRHPLPDYLNDLNAMYNVESTFINSAKRRPIYVRCLRDIRADIDFWHATAAQRAEAFLKTIGKWSDE